MNPKPSSIKTEANDMSQKTALIATLKQVLKSKGLTYSAVASKLGMSEAGIKRMFSANDFSLSRLDDLCKIIDIEISDLTEMMLRNQSLIKKLTFEQENTLVGDVKLLMLAHLLMSHWTYEQVAQEYDFDEHQLIRYLATLDRMKIIDLLPNNRIKLKVSRDFTWLKNGPIERFFKTHVQGDFFKSEFAGPGEIRLFVSGMLSKKSSGDMIQRIERLGLAFDEALTSDQDVEFDDKFGTGLVVAMRPWKLDIFEKYRKTQ
jgi:transcriptional regulator with XRE-family HTH domain